MGARIVVCRWSAPLELAMPCSARRATSSSCMGRLGAHAGAKNVLMPTPLRSLSWGALTHGARDGPCRKGRRCHGGAHRGVQARPHGTASPSCRARRVRHVSARPGKAP